MDLCLQLWPMPLRTLVAALLLGNGVGVAALAATTYYSSTDCNGAVLAAVSSSLPEGACVQVPTSLPAALTTLFDGHSGKYAKTVRASSGCSVTEATAVYSSSACSGAGQTVDVSSRSVGQCLTGSELGNLLELPAAVASAPQLSAKVVSVVGCTGELPPPLHRGPR